MNLRKLFSLFKNKNAIEFLESPISDNLLINKQTAIDLLIEDKILDVKIHYSHAGQNDWLDTCITFIELEKNGVICFPISGDEYFENTTIEKKSKSILENYQKIICGSKIQDIYYFLDENGKEFDQTQISCIVLNNGYVLEENRMSPEGLNSADLFCKTIEDFKNDHKFKIYSIRDKALKKI